jgi:hypothetical protein
MAKHKRNPKLSAQERQLQEELIALWDKWGAAQITDMLGQMIGGVARGLKEDTAFHTLTSVSEQMMGVAYTMSAFATRVSELNPKSADDDGEED